MKAYIQRLKEACPTRRFIFWWIIRALMIFAFIKGFFPDEGEAFDITDPLQVGANLLCTFLWEIFMLFPQKSVFRHMDSGFQTALCVGIFLASFGGKFMNLYYDLAWWDIALHFIGGGACVFFGYETVCALQKRDKKAAPMSIVMLCSVGFSFLAATGWELFEFTFDQIACMGGGVGDAQHWSYGLAEGTPKVWTLFNPVYTAGSEYGDRWPLMDTMGDIVLNTIGALAAYVALKINPYRHKGENSLNKVFAEKTEKETVTK